MVVVKPEIFCGCVDPSPTTDAYSTISPLEKPWLVKLIKLCDVEIPDGFTKSFLFVNVPPSITFISEMVFFAVPVKNLWVPLREVVPKEITFALDW